MLRVEEGSGRVVLEADAGEDVRAVALDATRRILWTFSPGTLRSFGGDGEELAAVPVTVPMGRALLAVDPVDGSVALAAGRGLWRFDAAGTPLGATALDGRLRGLAFDARQHRLWVATTSSLQAFNAGMQPASRLAMSREAPLAGLAVAAETGMVWTVGGGHLWKLGPDGRLLMDLKMPELATVAGDGRGGAWAASSRDLFHLSAAGRVTAHLQPFAGAGAI
ncbi:MAG TPA: hypothetical protein VIE43_19920, partial [Thermoanaerobaculia bacterium]|nr:hypothetical protein [Thermoanaerobaculia bacterium]